MVIVIGAHGDGVRHRCHLIHYHWRQWIAIGTIVCRHWLKWRQWRELQIVIPLLKSMAPLESLVLLASLTLMASMKTMNHHLHQWIANVSIGAIDTNDVSDAIYFHWRLWKTHRHEMAPMESFKLIH